MPTPLGIVRSTYELTEHALRFTSDDALSGSEDLPWASVREGCTAAMAGMAGRGMPDLPRWAPAKLEWLMLSRIDSDARAFSRALPQGDARDALVEAVRRRLGTRWLGEGLSLAEARRRLDPQGASQWGAWKVAGLVLAVLAALLALLFVLAQLLHPMFLAPIAAAIGAWMVGRACSGLRDASAAAGLARTPVGRARPGLVALEGQAVSAETTTTLITGRNAVWWDVTVEGLSEDTQRVGEWRQIAVRHGGRIDRIDIEDDSGRLAVWLPEATLLLKVQVWESERDALPSCGSQWLDEMGYPWRSERRLRVTERCVEVGQPLYILGTLAKRRDVRAQPPAQGLDRLVESLRTGRWRRELVTAAPPSLRVLLAVLIGFLDLFTGVGRGGERPHQPPGGDPPSIGPDAAMVWKGEPRAPFLVSDHPQPAALSILRRRSLVWGGFGLAAMVLSVQQFAELLFG